jgi:chromosome partitioning protein
MIVTLGHTKGGVGKSTLALNIAIERQRSGFETLLIDGDPRQTSVSKAVGMRGDSGITPELPCIVLEDARALRNQLKLLKERYQDIVIDVGGKDSSGLRAALTATDVLLLPVAPESVEIWAIEDVLDVVSEARLINDFKVVAFLNRAKPTGRDNEDTLVVLREYEGIEILTVQIGNRSVFSGAFGRGLSVSEYRPVNAKAREEVALLISSVYGDGS